MVKSDEKKTQNLVLLMQEAMKSYIDAFEGECSSDDSVIIHFLYGWVREQKEIESDSLMMFYCGIEDYVMSLNTIYNQDFMRETYHKCEVDHVLKELVSQRNYLRDKLNRNFKYKLDKLDNTDKSTP